MLLPIRFTKKRILLSALGLFAALLISGVGYWVYERSSGQSEYAKLEAELAKTEPHWRFPELNTDRASKIPADDANLYLKCAHIATMVPQSLNDWESDKNENRKSIESLIPGKPTIEAIQARDAVRKQCEQVIAAARALKQYPRGGAILSIPANPVSAPLNHLGHLRRAAWVLDFSCWNAAIDGDVATAISDTIIVLQLARAIDDEPHNISQIVRVALGSMASKMAERTLCYSESKADLAELQNALRNEAEAPIWESIIRAQRAETDQIMVWLDDTNVFPATGKTISDTYDNYATSYYRCYIPHCRAKNIEISSMLLEISRRPPQEWRGAFLAIPKSGAYRERLLNELSLCDDLHLKSSLRQKATLRTAAAAIACERYRQANGHWPGKLIDIPKSILPETPLDPFDGQPLRLLKNDDGITLYSTGVNKKVNQDIWAPDKGNTIPEISFRLWDVPQRGKLMPIK